MTGAAYMTLGRYVLEDPVLHVRVAGEPITQGSIRSLGKGRPSIHSNKDRLLPWRDKVSRAFEEAMGPVPLRLDGPVAIDCTFTVRKPQSAPKRRRTFPMRKPDGDKLLRAIFDAATAAGVWVDDARAVEWSGRKVFPGEHPESLLVPGVVITVWRVEVL